MSVLNSSIHPAKGWLVLIPAMTVPFIASIFYFDLFADRPFAQALYGLVKLFTLLWPLLGTYLFVRVWIPGFELRGSVHREAIPFGIISGLSIVAIMILGLFTPVGDAVYDNAWRIRAKAEELNFLDYYIPFAIFLSFFHSLLEEYYWRWFVFGNLRQLCNFHVASLLSAFAFASHHVIVLKEYFPMPWALFFGFSVVIGGMLWNTMYEKQKTLAGAWVSHMIVDLGIMGVGYLILFP